MNTHSHHTDKQDAIPITSPPQRIISLAPALTESLLDLNLGKRLVGITEKCPRPLEQAGHIASVGDPSSPNIKQILDLRPDLVVTHENTNPPETLAQVQKAGIPVWVTRPRTVLEAINILWTIMDAFEEPSMVERVRWIERQYDWTIAAAKENVPVNTCVLLHAAPWRTFNHQPYSHNVLEVCGGANVFADHTQECPAISPGNLSQTQPDIILLAQEAFSPDQVAAVAAVDTPAARKNRIHLCDSTLFTWPGTRIAHALHDIPPLLAIDREG